MRFVAPALVVLVGVFRWPRRRQRGLAGLVGVEVALFSAVLFVSINDRLYGGVTAYAVLSEGGSPTGAHGLTAHSRRWPRLVWLWVGAPQGLLLWAPACAIALVAVWLLARSRRERLARVLGEQADVEVTAGFLLACAPPPRSWPSSSPPTIAGPWFGGRQLVIVLPLLGALASWGLRHFPRAGAVLIALTLLTTVWVLAAVRLDADAGLAPPRGALPWSVR